MRFSQKKKHAHVYCFFPLFFTQKGIGHRATCKKKIVVGLCDFILISIEIRDNVDFQVDVNCYTLGAREFFGALFNFANCQ